MNGRCGAAAEIQQKSRQGKDPSTLKSGRAQALAPQLGSESLICTKAEAFQLRVSGPRHLRWFLVGSFRQVECVRVVGGAA